MQLGTSSGVVLEILEGPEGPGKIPLMDGRLLRIGRSEQADISRPLDRQMSSMHFSIVLNGSYCELCDLDSTRGTQVNGQSVGRTLLQNGDRVVAGQTVFVLHARETAIGAPQFEGDDLVTILSEQAQPLFAILDAARDRRVLEILEESNEAFRSLYEGKQGDELADYAPYLVRLPVGSPLLDTLLREGWGRSWGVYLRCSLPLNEARHHFRHFLMVHDEHGEEFYFRFYDPRVLRGFLPSCREEERAEFFGPVECFLMEGYDPGRLLTFQPSGIDTRQHVRVGVMATAGGG
jgi:pSer/pThr/pTyr-binding forkhead associated (FHA) protein